MSSKKQLRFLSFAQRGKPLKKARLEDAGPVKVAKRVGPLEEETCRWKRRRQCRWKRRRRWRRWLGCHKRPSKEKEEKCQEQLPTKALFIMNGTLNGHLLL